MKNNCQYKPPAWKKQGDEWIVSHWETMASDFDLKDTDLTRWHECMVGQGRPWEICRLLYGIRAVIDLSPEAADFLRPWKTETIAKRFDLTPLIIVDQHKAAITYWKQWNAQARISTKSNESPIVTTPSNHSNIDEGDIFFTAKPSPLSTSNNSSATKLAAPSAFTEPSPTPRSELPKFAIPTIPPNDVDIILTSLRLNKKLNDPDSRAHIANRAMALQQYLVNPLLKENARQILVHEITLMQMEDHLTRLSDKIERSNNSEKLDDYTAEYREIQSAYTKLTETYQKQLEKLGVEEIEKDNIKAHAIDTIGYVTQAIRAYRANGDNTLIDGVFRADEIIWQLEPVKLRPSQYRPDIVIAIREAFDPANLFDPQFKPKGVTKKACDKLRKVIKAIDEEWGIKDNSIPEIEAPATDTDTDTDTYSEQSADAPPPITNQEAESPLPSQNFTAAPSPYQTQDTTSATTPTPIPHFALHSLNRDDDAMSIVQ